MSFVRLLIHTFKLSQKSKHCMYLKYIIYSNNVDVIDIIQPLATSWYLQAYRWVGT